MLKTYNQEGNKGMEEFSEPIVGLELGRKHPKCFALILVENKV